MVKSTGIVLMEAEEASSQQRRTIDNPVPTHSASLPHRHKVVPGGARVMLKVSCG